MQKETNLTQFQLEVIKKEENEKIIRRARLSSGVENIITLIEFIGEENLLDSLKKITDK